MELVIIILAAAAGAVVMGLVTRSRRDDSCGTCANDCEKAESCDVRS